MPGNFRSALIAFLVLISANAAHAQASKWGVLDEIAKREWTTEKEPRVRVSRFSWEEKGRVLIARHGFQSRLQFGDDKFADTVQRFVHNPGTGAIDVTYTYEDGRPPLKSVIRIEPDGAAIETFTDPSGVQKRNVYRSPQLSLNVIERQEMKASAWTDLGSTRKTGLTPDEIAENKRRAEEAHQLALAEAAARDAAYRAQLAAEQAERDAQASYEPVPERPMGAVFLDELQAMGRQAQAEADRSRRELDRTIARVQAEEAAKRAQAAREEANRIAAENARRVQEANARQQAIADQYAQKSSDTEAQSIAARATADAEKARRAEEQRRAAEDNAQREAEQRKATADAERERREQQAQVEAERRKAEEQRLLAERNAPVDWPESVTLCAKDDDQARFGNYRCVGSLQMSYVNFDKPNWAAMLNQTCGGPFDKRDLGMVNGYRAFGCGFGLEPGSTGDIPRRYGISYVPGRIIYRCPRSASRCQTR